MAGGRLYHCCFCRLQFYDRRPLADRSKHAIAPGPVITSGADTTERATAAKSDG
jgi:hypothetical protein